MRVYISGPMRGIPEYNFPAFHAAAETLRALGHEVLSPAEQDVHHGGPAAAEADMKGTMRRDLDALLQQDAIVLLDGWNRSRGACIERHVADVCGFPVFLFEPKVEGALVALSPHDWRWRAQG